MYRCSISLNFQVAAAGLLENMAKNLKLFQKDDCDIWDSPKSKPVHIKEAAMYVQLKLFFRNYHVCLSYCVWMSEKIKNKRQFYEYINIYFQGTNFDLQFIDLYNTMRTIIT